MAEKAIYVRHAIVTDGSRPIKGLLLGPCVGAFIVHWGGGCEWLIMWAVSSGGTAERNNLNMLCASNSRGWRAKQPAEQTTSSKRARTRCARAEVVFQ